MASFFDILFGSGGSRPVRRDARLRLKLNAKGEPIIEPVEGEAFNLSQEGSIDRVKIEPDRFYHCGCNAEKPLGGKCGEPNCHAASCVECHGKCHSCDLHLCPEHSHSVEEKGYRIRLCRSCYDMRIRRQRLRFALRLVISPFVELNEK